MEFVIITLVVAIVAAVVVKVIKRKDPEGLGAKIDELEKPLEEAWSELSDKGEVKLEELKEKVKEKTSK
jgi:hypothetical protein